MFDTKIMTAETETELLHEAGFAESQKSAKRKAIEKMILDTFAILDPSGLNTDRFKEQIGSLNNEAFTRWIQSMKAEKEFVSFEAIVYENEPTLDQIEKAAAFLKLPLDEHVFFKDHKTSDGADVRGRSSCSVGLM
jgi:hypothetical protein